MSYLPICEISAYGRRDWVIKARVSSRQQVRTFNKKDGTAGKVFHCDLLDADGGEIRATLWGAAADKFDAVLSAGRVYTFAGGQAKLANKKYNGGLNHSYELSFDDRCVVEPVEDDTKILQVKISSFTTLRELPNLTVPATCNVCVVIKQLEPCRSAKTKVGDMAVRKLVVVDSSECSMEVSLWREAAQLADTRLAVGTVVAFKGIKIGEYGGRSGSVFDLSSMHFDLPNKEFRDLQAWWAGPGQTMSPRSLSDDMQPRESNAVVMAGSLPEFDAETAKMQEGQTLYWNTRAHFSFLKTKKEGAPLPLWYEACPTDRCNKKIVNGECLKCNKTVPNPLVRYVLTSLKLEDADGDKWVGAFDEVGVEMLGMKADKLRSSGDIEKTVASKFYAQEYAIKLRAKVETYEGQSRVRAQVLQAKPVDHAEDGAALLNELKGLYAGTSVSAQAEVKALLADWDALSADAGAAPEWTNPLAGLRAVAAC